MALAAASVGKWPFRGALLEKAALRTNQLSRQRFTGIDTAAVKSRK